MRRRYITALLAFVMLCTLLPATALADNNITTTKLDLSNNPPAVQTTYIASDGTVVWDPTVSPAMLTFNNATINIPATGPYTFLSYGIKLPDIPVTVVFNGTNNITVGYCTQSYAFRFANTAAFILTEGSRTNITVDGQNAYGVSIYKDSTPPIYSDVSISGSGALNITTKMGVSLTTISARDNKVSLTGGTLSFNNPISSHDVVLGGVIVPASEKLDLANITNISKGASGAMINGELILPSSTTAAQISALCLTGNGVVKAGADIYYLGAPTASSVSITGSFAVGETLTGSYTYNDSEGDAEGASTFKWYRSDSSAGLNKSEIPGATLKTYVPASADEGKYISFEVTPVAAAGRLTGDAVESAIFGAIAPAPVPVAFASLTADGSDTESTTALTLTFDQDVAGLSADDITVTGATRGTLTETGTGVYTLTVSNISVADNCPVNVHVTKDGFTFTPTNMDVTVRKYTLPTPTVPSGNGGSSISSGVSYAGNTYTGVWSGGALTVQADKEKCTGVSVDNKPLNIGMDCTLTSGSTIITFTPVYLAALNDGTHTIRVQFTDGRYDGTFTTPLSTAITTTAAPNVPATGGMEASAILCLIAAVGFTALYARKRRYR